MPDIRADFTRILVDLGGPTVMYLATDQIECIRDHHGGSRILTISGKEYRTPLSPEEVIAAIAKDHTHDRP